MVFPLTFPWDRAFEVRTIGLFNSLRAIACDPWTATGEAAAHLYRYIQSDIKLLFDRGAISWKHLANASQRLNAWQQPFLGPATAEIETWTM
jgi:hypothetical protein